MEYVATVAKYCGGAVVAVGVSSIIARMLMQAKDIVNIGFAPGRFPIDAP